MPDTLPEFRKFLSACSGLLQGESPQFLGLIQKRYDSCSQDFRHSPDMVHLLHSTTAKMLADKKRFFVHLKDFVTELKAWSSSSGGKGPPGRKRQGESLHQSVAKVARLEDSTSEGSDLEGRLHRALGVRGQSSGAHDASSSSEAVTRRSSATPSLAPGQPDPTDTEADGSSCRGHSPDPPTAPSSSNLEDGCSEVSAASPRSGESPLPVATRRGVMTLTQDDSVSDIPAAAADDLSRSQSPSCPSLNASSHPPSPRSIPSPRWRGVEREEGGKGECVSPTPGKVGTGHKANSNSGCLTAPHKRSESARVRVTPVTLFYHTPNTTSDASHSGSRHTPPTEPDEDCAVPDPPPIHRSLGAAIDRLKYRLASRHTATHTLPPSPQNMNGEASDDDDDDVDVDDGEEKVRKDNMAHHSSSEKRRQPSTVVKQSPERSRPSTSSGGGGGGGGSKGGHSRSSPREAEERWQERSEERSEGKVKENKNVRRLEKLLEKIRDEIEKVREKDLSLDDLDAEDSSYIYEDRLQKKFIKVWQRLCQLKGRNTSSGRPIERKFRYEGTRFPEINRKVEKFVNRPNCFPDYHDIRGIIKKVNTRSQLGLNVMQINSISKETFMDIGEGLQRRRQEDFISTFHSRQTVPYCTEQDPAIFDEELRQKLEENHRIGKSRLEGVIRKYTDLQMAMRDMEKDEIEREASAIHHRPTPHNSKTLPEHHSKPSKSPSCTHPKSPSNDHSKSPTNSHSKSPSNTHSKSPSNTHSKSPSNSHSKSPSHTYSRSPSNSHSKSPSYSRSKSPSHTHSKSPSHTHSKSPSHTHSKSPSHTHSKSPSHTHSKSPSYSRSKSPSHTHSKSPSHTHSKSFRSKSPSYAHSKSPPYPHSESPAYPHSRSPAYPHSQYPPFPHAQTVSDQRCSSPSEVDCTSVSCGHSQWPADCGPVWSSRHHALAGADCQSVRPLNCESISLADPEPIRRVNCKLISPADYQSIPPSPCWSTSPSGHSSKSPPDCPAKSSRDPHRSKSPSEHRVKHPSHHPSIFPSNHHSISPPDRHSIFPSNHHSIFPPDRHSASSPDPDSISPSDPDSISPADPDPNPPPDRQFVTLSRPPAAACVSDVSASEPAVTAVCVDSSNTNKDDDNEDDDDELYDDTEGQWCPPRVKRGQIMSLDGLRGPGQRGEEEEEEEGGQLVQQLLEDPEDDDQLNMIEMDIAEECHLLMEADSQDGAQWLQQGVPTDWQHEFGPDWRREAGTEPRPLQRGEEEDVRPGKRTNGVGAENGAAEGRGSPGGREEEGGDGATPSTHDPDPDPDPDPRPRHKVSNLAADAMDAAGWTEKTGEDDAVWIEVNEEEDNDDDDDDSPRCHPPTPPPPTVTSGASPSPPCVVVEVVELGADDCVMAEDLQEDLEDVLGHSQFGARGPGTTTQDAHSQLQEGGEGAVEAEEQQQQSHAENAVTDLDPVVVGSRSDQEVAEVRVVDALDGTDVISIDVDAGGVADGSDVVVAASDRKEVALDEGGEGEGAVQVNRVDSATECAGDAGNDTKDTDSSRAADIPITNRIARTDDPRTDDPHTVTHLGAYRTGTPGLPIRTASPNTVSRLRVGSLPVSKKSASPVKVNPGLRLPRCLQGPRSGASAWQTAGGGLHPRRTSGPYNGDSASGNSITIGSSDEEGEGRAGGRDWVAGPPAKAEGGASVRPQEGDVIVLSDSD